MKKKFLYLILITALGMTSCSDFLDVRPVGNADESTLLDQDGINKVITGMYARLQMSEFDDYFCGTLSNYVWGDVLGGSANKGSNYADQTPFTSLETYSITADNSYLLRKWQTVYDGVYRANTLIAMADKIKDELSVLPGESKDFYTETIAQAMFIRGLWHFEAIKCYGAAVPYVGSEEYASSVSPAVSNVDGGNYIYIWDKVEADLQYAYDNLPDTWASQRGRVNKWAAAALLAKVKMYHSSPYNGKNATVNKWAEVKSLLETIMAQGKQNDGKRYKLANTYEELWVASTSDWTGESVFDIQTAISGTQTNTNALMGGPHIGMTGTLGSGGYGFYQPSYENVQSHIVDANGLPFMDGSYQNQAPLSTIAGSVISTDLTVYTDPRVDVSTGRFNVPYWDWAIPRTVDGWIREVSNGGPYLHKKYIKKRADNGSLAVSTQAGSSAKNLHLIRYADVILWYAEALIETGDWVGAREYVNQVRARAANWYLGALGSDMASTTSSYVFDDKVNGTTGANAAGNYRIGLWPESQFATKEGALDALRWERKIELAMEGHRWYDLARWGIVGPVVTNFIQYERQYLSKYAASVYLNDWVTVPIPIDEINTMQGVLVQGVNWK